MKFLSRTLLATVTVLFFQQLAQAQSITVTGPSSPVTVADGEDFATRELRNAWDFNERLDIGWEQNFAGNSIGVANGVWFGTNEIAGGHVFPLFPDFKGTVHSEPLPGDKSLPLLGINHRINASKYTQLCYKVRPSSRSVYAVYWSNDESKSAYWPDGGNKGASFDGYYPYPWRLGIANTGWQIYCFDMSAIGSNFEQSAGSWSGNVFALRLDPSVNGPVGATTELDWVRVFDPSTSPTVNITWNTSGLNSFQMRTIYVDTDNSGYDGVPLKRFIDGVDPGTYALKTATLPPGNYYFYVSAQEAGPGQLTGPITYSNYSARLTINDTPIVHITSPSQTSGKEYAAEELGNAWDMDSSGTDLANLDRANYPDTLRQFTNESFAGSPDAEDAGTIFQAMANPPLPGFNEGDNQVHLKIPAGRPIDAGKYRYLVYRIAADATNFPTIEQRVREGWVTRFIWWNNDVIGDGGDPGGHVLYTGWHTYANDLWNQNLERGIPWTSNSFIKNLRIDPLETAIYTWFYLDWVRLYAENRPSNNEFTITWNLQDNDNSSFNVSLYYDNDNSGFDGTLITSLSGVSGGSNSYVWNTSGLPNGSRYYVYAVVSDGVNTAKYYSPVDVVMGDYVPSPVPRTGRAEFDYDGDAKSDLSAIRPGSVSATKSARKKKPKRPKLTPAASSILLSSTGATATNYHNDVNAKLIGVDLNGDRWADLITVAENTATGLLSWTGVLSRTARSFSSNLGLVGDVPFKGDFNGNHTDEIGVYRQGFWYVMNELSQLTLVIWGTAGDVQVPGDYDGDGSTDYAIWRPSTGEWFVINSGFASGYASSLVTQVQWGLYGDQPVQGDYDGDGRDDIAVFRPTDGNWYVQNSHDSSVTVQAWGHGYFGDIPFRGMDMNGDGKSDYVVFRPSVGYWYCYLSNGQFVLRVLGGPSHQLPVNH